MSNSLKDTISICKSELASYSDTIELDVSIIIEFITGISRVKQISDPSVELSEAQIDKINNLVQRRKTQEPIAYLINNKGFWKYDFYVDDRVLIPRPETELLVDNGINHIQSLIEQGSTTISILDLGCGSGCIGISILKDLQQQYLNRVTFELYLVDKSAQALDVARINANQLLKFESTENNMVHFVESDWFSNINTKFDLIVCNPPYIAAGDPRVYQGAMFEPSSALYADNFGHADVSLILATIRNFFKPKSRTLIEIGQGSADFFRDKVDQILVDSSGIERVLVLKN